MTKKAYIDWLKWIVRFEGIEWTPSLNREANIAYEEVISGKTPDARFKHMASQDIFLIE